MCLELMKNFTLTKLLAAVVAVLSGLLVAGISYGLLHTRAAAAAASPSASPTPTATAAPTPSPSPSPTPSATPSPTPKATAAPKPTATPKPTAAPTATPTPTALPQATLTLSSTEVSGSSNLSVTIAVDDGATVTVVPTAGITYWYEPGYLYLYPTASGSVAVTASLSGYAPTTATITVTYIEPTPVPTPTPTAAPAADTSGSTELLTPTLTRDSDLSFWFRNGMDGTKDYFFDYAAQYGVDPYLAIAIADHETGYGSSSYCNDLNNFGGLMDKSGNPKSYDSKQQGVEALIWLLNWYKNQGRTSVADIGAWYCPGEQLWVTRVTTIYNSFHQ